jgi:hypothetical protein
MNLRIDELAKQATTIASRETTDLDEWEFIFRKKFAELIIADTIESIRVKTVRTATSVPYAKCHLSGMEISQRLIKEHFGVEA